MPKLRVESLYQTFHPVSSPYPVLLVFINIQPSIYKYRTHFFMRRQVNTVQYLLYISGWGRGKERERREKERETDICRGRERREIERLKNCLLSSLSLSLCTSVSLFMFLFSCKKKNNGFDSTRWVPTENGKYFFFLTEGDRRESLLYIFFCFNWVNLDALFSCIMYNICFAGHIS